YRRAVGQGFAWDSYSGVNGLNGETAPYLMKRGQVLHPSERFLWIEGADGRGENLGSWQMSNYGTPSLNFSDAKFRDSPAAFHVNAAVFNYVDGPGEMHRWLDAPTIAYANDPSLGKDAGGASQPAAQNGSLRDQPWVGSRYPTTANP